jgi:RNA polymerase sigma factor (sigma-70 family)
MAKKFEVVYKENYNNVLNYINSKIKDRNIAEDETVKVFVKVSKHLDNYDPNKASFNSWLMTITNRVIIDYFRTNHQDRYQNVSNFVDSETGDETFQFVSHTDSEANYNIENRELRKSIDAAVNKLKPDYKRIAELHFIEGYNYQEVVEATNLPIGSVKAMIFRVREILQVELKSVRKALV